MQIATGLVIEGGSGYPPDLKRGLDVFTASISPSLVDVAISLDTVFKDKHTEFTAVKNDVGHAIDAFRGDARAVTDLPRCAARTPGFTSFTHPHLADASGLAEWQEISCLGDTGDKKQRDETEQRDLDFHSSPLIAGSDSRAP
jgi:hypothetical protein